MVQSDNIVGHYTGCSGQVVFPVAPHGICLRGVSNPGRETARKGCYALQWLNPHGWGTALPSPAENEHVHCLAPSPNRRPLSWRHGFARCW